ncbi:MAG TPA: hypothetical protein VIL92_14545 [Gaiellaceae bacterium]
MPVLGHVVANAKHTCGLAVGAVARHAARDDRALVAVRMHQPVFDLVRLMRLEADPDRFLDR